MSLAPRVVVLAVVVLTTYFLVYWGALLVLARLGVDGPPGLVALLCAAAVGWWYWRTPASARAGLFACVMLGALVTGGVGFSIGFFGPMVFAPGANQGPLLGIFITGPAGFVLGGMGGLVYWWGWARARHGA